MFNLFQVVLRNQTREGLVQTGFDTLWRFVRDLDWVLQEEEWENLGLFYGEPDTSVFVEIQDCIRG